MVRMKMMGRFTVAKGKDEDDDDGEDFCAEGGEDNEEDYSGLKVRDDGIIKGKKMMGRIIVASKVRDYGLVMGEEDACSRLNEAYCVRT